MFNHQPREKHFARSKKYSFKCFDCEATWCDDYVYSNCFSCEKECYTYKTPIKPEKIW